MTTESSHVEQLVQRGIAAAREGRYGVAQQALREAVRLAPQHEQAWLWLSGVEDTDQGKVTALQQVLRINPQNAAAHRGLEHLTQPKKVDLASLLPAAAPPPAKAAWSPPPAQAALPSVVPPTWTPPVSPQATATLPEAPAINVASVSPVLETTAEDQHVSPDMVADLRPALDKARKKRPFWPQTSEIGIMILLFFLLLGGFLGTRAWLRGKFPERAVTPQASVRANSNAQPTVAAVVQPSAVAQSTAPPVQTGGAFTSRAYNLQVDSATPAEDNRSVSVSVLLRNPTRRVIGFRQGDFQLRNGSNGRLTLSAANSSIFAGKSDAQLSIPANGEVSGTLVFTGDASRSPLTLIWQPFNGGVNQQIVVK